MTLASEDVLTTAAVVRRGVTTLGRRLRAERPENGLSVTKISVLASLRRVGPLTPGALAALQRTRPQSLTRVLAELTTEDLITREPDPTDGRQTVLRLTADGIEVLRADMRQRDAWLALVLADLSETERQVLKLAGALMEEIAENEEASALRYRDRRVPAIPDAGTDAEGHGHVDRRRLDGAGR